jgi:hypothetical protein
MRDGSLLFFSDFCLCFFFSFAAPYKSDYYECAFEFVSSLMVKNQGHDKKERRGWGEKEV